VVSARIAVYGNGGGKGSLWSGALWVSIDADEERNR
jgi:hypothetical protein